jgi:hypothetical protein
MIRTARALATIFRPGNPGDPLHHKFTAGVATWRCRAKGVPNSMIAICRIHGAVIPAGIQPKRNH